MANSEENASELLDNLEEILGTICTVMTVAASNLQPHNSVLSAFNIKGYLPLVERLVILPTWHKTTRQSSWDFKVEKNYSRIVSWGNYKKLLEIILWDIWNEWLMKIKSRTLTTRNTNFKPTIIYICVCVCIYIHIYISTV